MIMSNCHFKRAVTVGTQRHEVIGIVSKVLILKITTPFNVMNIQTSTAWTSFSTTVLAYLVALAYFYTDRFPVSTVGKLFPSAIVGAILTSHKLNSTFTRAKTTPIFSNAFERSEGFPAVLAIQIHSGYLAFTGAFKRAVLNIRSLLIKSFSTYSTVSIGHPGASPVTMAFIGTKSMRRFLTCSGWLSLEVFSAMITSKGHDFTDSIYCALSRTMINSRIVGFEFFPALEACLDH